VHFTFIDGAIGYDCARCGARCCHGLGFALPNEALIPFLGRAPQLAPFLQLQARGAHAFDLSGDGCWLLRDDKRCGLEVEHGRDAKPSVCRLFPLQVRRVAGQVVVDLQLLACPLEDAARMAASPASTVVRHADCAREVEAHAGPFTLDVPLAAGAPDDLMAREAEIRDRAAGQLDAGDSVAVVARAHDVAAEPLAAMRESWRRWLGVGGREDAEVARPFALALPSLRMAALTAGGTPPWMKLNRDLPARLVAGAFYTELSVHAGRAPTLRAIAELWRASPMLREALARWTVARELRDTPAPPGTPPELTRALDEVRATAPTRPLGEALAATGLPTPLRPVLLRLVADRLV
jgi:hypothetical protein